MRVAAFIFLLGFLIGCQGEGRFPDTYKCHFCLEQVKVGAKKCKHCGEDPYDGAEQTRLAHLLADDADELGIYDAEPVGNWPWQRRWPWWKWPIMVGLVVGTAAIPGGFAGILYDEKNQTGKISVLDPENLGHALFGGLCLLVMTTIGGWIVWVLY